MSEVQVEAQDIKLNGTKKRPKKVSNVEISTLRVMKDLAWGKAGHPLSKTIWNRIIFLFIFFLLATLFASLWVKGRYMSRNKEHFFKERKYELREDSVTHKKTWQWSGPKWEDDPYSFFGIKGVGLDKYIREIDIAGLLGGFVGIFVGLFITVIIEKQNRAKQIQNDAEMQHLRDAINQLKDTSTKIDESVVKMDDSISNVLTNINKIVERDNKFFPTETFEKVLNKIEEIVLQSLQDNTNLMIMNHSSSFGYLLGFKAKTVLNYLKENKLENQGQVSYKEYHKAFETLRANQARVFKNLRETGEKIMKAGSEVTYVTLSTKGDYQSAYVRNYLFHIMKNAEIVLYNEYSVEYIKELIDETSAELDRYYFISQNIISRNSSENQDDIKSRFIQHLVDKQKEEIYALRSEQMIVKEVEEIPIQVYLSDLKNAKGTCLFMFVNHQTIGKSGHNLVAFASKNEPYIINSFKNIIEQTN
jgi:hypothetical protein